MRRHLNVSNFINLLTEDRELAEQRVTKQDLLSLGLTECWGGSGKFCTTGWLGGTCRNTAMCVYKSPTSSNHPSQAHCRE